MRRNEHSGLRAKPEGRSDEKPALRAEAVKVRASSQPISQVSVLGPRALEIHIDELVLHGFSPGDRYPIADAVERELTRLFIQEGLPPSLAHAAEIARIDGGAFRVAAVGKQESKQESTGAHVARAIYGGLRR